MSVYYNEHDRFAATWLRELIADGLIPAGDVDERDVQLVQPADLAGYRQCHFFAGIGGWPYALQLAGWGDRPVWTGSCPCQPFSSAGKGAGFDDSRHLWPSWFRLIRECRPSVVFGEQVASADGLAWFDTVSTDLEAEAYAVGSADLCAAGVGAPHIRQRLFFVAHAEHAVRRALGGSGADERDGEDARREEAHGEPGACRAVRLMAHAGGRGVQPVERGLDREATGTASASDQWQRVRADAEPAGAGLQTERTTRALVCGDADRTGALGLANASSHGYTSERRLLTPAHGGGTSSGPADCRSVPWSDVIWLPCRDGKARPTQPGIQPLAHGVPNRVGTLRGAGNAIVPQVGAEFIRAFLEQDE